MISNVTAGSSAYLQQVSSKNDRQETSAVEQTKETGKVESIKEQIKNGEYKFDSQKTAEAIAQALI